MPRKHIDTPSAYSDPFPTAFRALLSGETGRRGKVSQQEVADYIGKTRQTVGYYADGTAKPDIDTIGKLADFFDVTTDYLLGRSGYTDSELRVGSLESYGFTEAATRNVYRLHVGKSLESTGSQNAEGSLGKEELFTGAAFDMLVRLLESQNFVAFLGNVAVYTDLHFPEQGGLMQGEFTMDDCRYAFKTATSVYKDIVWQSCLRPLRGVIDEIEQAKAEHARMEAEDNAENDE